MRIASRASTPALAVVAIALAATLAGCSQPAVKPAATHIRDEPGRPEGAIPAPVQVAPLLPPPSAAPRAETYSVVVNNVRVQDLLFALARDAKLNVDVHPGVSGVVTLNAIDQTLPQLLGRIAKQVDMRYEMDGPNLVVMRDTPYLRTYKIDYVSASRNVKMQSTSSTQFGGSSGTSGGSAGTGSTATVDVVSTNALWEQIVQNVKDVLQETDKVIPLTAGAAAAGQPAAGQPAVQPQAAPAPGAAPGAAPAVAAPSQPNINFREAAAVIGNRESGVLFVRASSRQHEKVQEFLDQVMASAKRQVLVEATIVEVQLNNQYQRGINWSMLRSAGSTAGFDFRSNAPGGTPAAVDMATGFTVAYNSGPGINFIVNALKLLESFGDVRVLSSPKISVLNNQTALLRVTRDIVYFTITPSSTPVTVVGGAGGVTITPTFTTAPNVAAEGLMMSVLPQINDADIVVLNVRPTIRRKVADATDPNPSLTAAAPNKIPVFETRELDSILRVQSGQTAMLGGLMQDTMTNVEDTIPGLNTIPGIGSAFAQRDNLTRKTELVIFLKATVIRDSSIDGDYGRFRDLLPQDDFFRKPNAQRPPG